MIALLTSCLIVAYLFIPAGLFRVVSSLFIPLKKFQRTKTQEVTFSALTCLLPFVLSLCFVWTSCGRHPFLVEGTYAQRRDDYKTVLAALYAERASEMRQKGFWEAATRVERRQLRFAFWYWLFVGAEAFIFAGLVCNYGKHRQNRPYRWFAEKFLLRTVSEWHVLLTTFNFPLIPKRKVVLDVLTVEDHFYSGDLGDYFLDPDGTLSGLLLEKPTRFDRQAYLKQKEHDPKVDRKQFWKEIPSNNLYVSKDKILNLNVRYPTVEISLAAAATQQLAAEGIHLTVESPPEKTA